MQNVVEWGFLSVLSAVAALVFWVFHKVMRIDRTLALVATRRDLDNAYRQVEALDALHRDLHFSRSLPPLRGFAGSPDFLLALAECIRVRRPMNVLELGSGASTIAIARALQLCGGGRVISLEHDRTYVEKTVHLLNDHGLGAFATVVHAPLVDHVIGGVRYRWYSISEVPETTFEMIFVDGPPASTQPLVRYPALPLLLPRLAPQCVLLVDDTKRRDEVLMLARWRKEFSAFVQTDLFCEKGCVMLAREGAHTSDEAGRPGYGMCD